MECRQKMLDDCRRQSGTSHHHRQRSPPHISKLPTSTDPIPQLRRILDMLRLRRRTRRQRYPLLGMRLREALTTPHPTNPPLTGWVFLCPDRSPDAGKTKKPLPVYQLTGASASGEEKHKNLAVLLLASPLTLRGRSRQRRRAGASILMAVVADQQAPQPATTRPTVKHFISI